LFQPVYPANDPTTLVAFTATSMHWIEVLTATVPSYVTGLTCVISTDTESFTYEIRVGGPELIGPGDLHDRAYESFAHSVILNDIETNATASATYTLTVYPTDGMLNSFQSKSPLAVAIGFFAVIATCAVLFFVYDFLMRHEAHERKMILEMKRRFVRFISHEIRTPLNTVCMGLELLELELQDAATDTHEVVDQDEKMTEEDRTFWYSVTIDIKENTHLAVTVLNDLLNYDKIETGTLKLELGKVPIWDFVATAVAQFQIQAVNKKVELKVDIEKPQKPRDSADVESGEPDCSSRLNVLGDDMRLGQVIRNVVSNALKFTPTGGTIGVTTSHVENGLPDAEPLRNDDGEFECTYPRAGSIQIRVKDEGVGLEKEQLEMLFSEGVQFNANKLQHGGGSGLGLAIAKGVVEQHGGTITAESDGHGQGSTFVVELPLYEYPIEEAKQQEDDKESTTNTASLTLASSQQDPLFQRRRILVVEDSDSSRKMLVRLLERAGHTCVMAVNGQDAVHAMTTDLAATEENPNHVPFDAVLMDSEMPVLNGPEATKQIREMGFKATILGVTGNVLSEDVEYFMAHGADRVLPKPISMKLLKDYWGEQQCKGRS
jgi:signal transduction histidine kinase/CheY-like chemotaxis protein